MGNKKHNATQFDLASKKHETVTQNDWDILYLVTPTCKEQEYCNNFFYSLKGMILLISMGCTSRNVWNEHCSTGNFSDLRIGSCNDVNIRSSNLHLNHPEGTSKKSDIC